MYGIYTSSWSHRIGSHNILNAVRACETGTANCFLRVKLWHGLALGPRHPLTSGVKKRSILRVNYRLGPSRKSPYKLPFALGRGSALSAVTTVTTRYPREIQPPQPVCQPSFCRRRTQSLVQTFSLCFRPSLQPASCYVGTPCGHINIACVFPAQSVVTFRSQNIQLLDSFLGVYFWRSWMLSVARNACRQGISEYTRCLRQLKL